MCNNCLRGKSKLKLDIVMSWQAKSTEDNLIFNTKQLMPYLHSYGHMCVYGTRIL